ncbi:hypothetical protein OJAV_G00006700 [Oryzias javanicus]|uniref:Uncharacterized protein n=1 Tax=Oryzias javanicus TaxID=123683 RepID=A0A3S2PHY2_ORYJA|nr:hypothetical protein OJAV_G00006700 [Oryzias javanicus]
MYRTFWKKKKEEWASSECGGKTSAGFRGQTSLTSLRLQPVPFSTALFCPLVSMTTGCHKDIALSTHLRSGRRKRLVPPTPDSPRNSGKEETAGSWTWETLASSARFECCISEDSSGMIFRWH